MNDNSYWYWLLGGSTVVLLGGLGYASLKSGRPAAALPASTTFGGTIQGWYADGARLHGYLPGNADTEERDITITPLRVDDDVAYTPDFYYYLGEPRRPERLGSGLRPY